MRQSIHEKLNPSDNMLNTEVGDIEKEEIVQPSRLLLFIYDALENFEYKNYASAGCIYSIVLSCVFSFFLAMKQRHFVEMPYLELIFIPSLILFCVNFRLINNSRILPYIQNQEQNWKAKQSGIFLILSIICFVASIKKCDMSFAVFVYLSAWPVNYFYDRIMGNYSHDSESILPFLGLFVGSAFSTNSLQTLMFNPEILDIFGVLLAFIGGLALCQSGRCLMQLGEQNLFTITHVISLLFIIFLPLFFPIEGLIHPTMSEWVFLTLVSGVLLFSYPILIRAFAIQNTTFVLVSFLWAVPFYQIVQLLLTGQLPHLFQILGSILLIFCSICLIQRLNVLSYTSNTQQKIVLHRGPASEKNLDVELQQINQ